MVQTALIAPRSFEDDAGAINVKALGYVYGFADAAMQIAGLQIEDERALMLLSHLYELFAEGKGDDYLRHAIGSLGWNAMKTGVMLGGEDYNQWVKSDGKIIPWGLGRELRSSNLFCYDGATN